MGWDLSQHPSHPLFPALCVSFPGCSSCRSCRDTGAARRPARPTAAIQTCRKRSRGPGSATRASAPAACTSRAPRRRSGPSRSCWHSASGSHPFCFYMFYMFSACQPDATCCRALGVTGCRDGSNGQSLCAMSTATCWTSTAVGRSPLPCVRSTGGRVVHASGQREVVPRLDFGIRTRPIERQLGHGLLLGTALSAHILAASTFSLGRTLPPTLIAAQLALSCSGLQLTPGSPNHARRKSGIPGVRFPAEPGGGARSVAGNRRGDSGRRRRPSSGGGGG